jgi:mycoredoxin
MLKVYAASWCPHCVKAVAFLKGRGIPFEYYEIEEQPEELVRRVVEVNGGEDWGVPTLEFEGRWRPGKVFDPEGFERDLKNLGVPL